MPLNRILPAGPPRAYRTFRAVRPRSSHTRAATCEEFGCERWTSEWMVALDLAQPNHRKMAEDIARGPVKRSWRLVRLPGGQWVEFHFPPGTPCFAFQLGHHRVPIRPPVLLAYRGDWRAQLSRQVPMKMPEWLERFAENQDQVAQRVKRG